jgi:hypothetical protein
VHPGWLTKELPQHTSTPDRFITDRALASASAPSCPSSIPTDPAQLIRSLTVIARKTD